MQDGVMAMDDPRYDPMHARYGRTHRLELADQTLREWDCTVVASGQGQGILLDRSAFYPGGGGQPPDEGVLLWGGVRTRISGTRKGDELYLIPADGDPLPPVGTRSEEHTSELQSRLHLVCRLLLEKKNEIQAIGID